MAILLEWNVAAIKFFESGLDRGVLYARHTDGTYPLGVAWEGLMSVSEKPGGAEPTDLWANNTKYAQLVSAETFDGSIEAYTFPDEFLVCDGVVVGVTGLLIAQQARTPFGLSYRTWIGSEAAGQTADYKIHCIYGCLIQPSEVSRATINDSPEAATFSWEFKTTPAAATGFAAVSKITLDSRDLAAPQLLAVEEALYGVDTPTDAYLPLPDALIALATA
ncbi:MAG: hypothetical protein DRI46_12940 [Chloroflexi bacterium]|nr:MAG: hypothetical protein DRI46_12940 [Chloroflexota bacterium]